MRDVESHRRYSEAERRHAVPVRKTPEAGGVERVEGDVGEPREAVVLEAVVEDDEERRQDGRQAKLGVLGQETNVGSEAGGRAK